MDDPFKILESSSTPYSSSTVSTDPLEEINKISKSRSARAEFSSGSGGAFDDLDPLSTIGKSANSFSPGRNNRRKDESPQSETPESATTREPMENSYFGYSESNTVKKVTVDQEPLFDMPDMSTDFQKSFGHTPPPPPPPQYYETVTQEHMSPTTEGQGYQSEDIWLSVSEIPLFTQPTAAPPPSRPPPPIPRQASRPETGSFSSSSRKKGDEFSSPSNYSQHSQSPKQTRPAAKAPPVSQFDELDDFARGGSQNNFDESANLHSSIETNAFSAAAASAAAMKDAMDKAEAKFRHAKEVREREYAKAARNKESGPLENDEQDMHEKELRENQERLEREKKQKEEEEEREQKRLQRERQGRQAVERANREARERAAIGARERVAVEARLKSERSAVEKVQAEARERAERAAVQRAQAEARERAAAEAKERAEKVAAEARERSAAETREKEVRDKARAEEARRRAERAAVERAAAEASERAAAEARERAAKMNQQKNDNDLESFFNMHRPSSAPKSRTNSTVSANMNNEIHITTSGFIRHSFLFYSSPHFCFRILSLINNSLTRVDLKLQRGHHPLEPHLT